MAVQDPQHWQPVEDYALVKGAQLQLRIRSAEPPTILRFDFDDEPQV